MKKHYTSAGFDTANPKYAKFMRIALSGPASSAYPSNGWSPTYGRHNSKLYFNTTSSQNNLFAEYSFVQGYVNGILMKQDSKETNIDMILILITENLSSGNDVPVYMDVYVKPQDNGQVISANVDIFNPIITFYDKANFDTEITINTGENTTYTLTKDGISTTYNGKHILHNNNWGNDIIEDFTNNVLTKNTTNFPNSTVRLRLTKINKNMVLLYGMFKMQDTFQQDTFKTIGTFQDSSVNTYFPAESKNFTIWGSVNGTQMNMQLTVDGVLKAATGLTQEDIYYLSEIILLNEI